MFKVFVTKHVSAHEKFEDAVKAFYAAVSALIERGTNEQMLETACWIEGNFPDGRKGVLHFPEFCEFGFDQGILLEGGKLADSIPDIPMDVLSQAFFIEGLRNIAQAGRAAAGN